MSIWKPLLPVLLVAADGERGDVGHDDVDAAELAGHVAHPRLQCRAVAHVECPTGGPDPLRLQRRHGAVDLVGVAGADGDVRPLVGERVGDRPPDAPRAARDDGVQAVEPEVHAQPPSR